jgi:hypothetical protein
VGSGNLGEPITLTVSGEDALPGLLTGGVVTITMPP